MTTVSRMQPTSLNETRLVFATFIFCALFHFCQYAARSAPSVMVPELSESLGLRTAAVGSLVGSYYYTYSAVSLVAGGALDRFGVRGPVSVGMLTLAVGCALFGTGLQSFTLVGRLLQGAGAAFAFTGAVYVATRNLPAAQLASAVGIAQAFGMFGGSAGQFVVARLIHGASVPWQWIWFGLAAVLCVLAVGMLLMPHGKAELAIVQSDPTDARATSGSWFDGYRTVFGNPQSWLCGLCAGLLFVPTTVGDMIWRVAFFTQGLNIGYDRAVLSASLVLFGWVIGCPLLGWISDWIGRRKPVVIVGGSILLVAEITVLYGSVGVADNLWLSLIFGIASGAAMLPYTIIKEVNPTKVAGTATGIMNLVVFATSAAVSAIVGSALARLGHAGGLHALQFREVGTVSLASVAGAIAVACFLTETGRQRGERLTAEII
ncbi:MFS transporter [Paraburkholderia sediminicola]|uniref:MFS transporter n=1 Tax=Paraburkholderia sediminicola TaxID=458836 RepID=UPI0038B7FA0C